jgi:hypothetical protein
MLPRFLFLLAALVAATTGCGDDPPQPPPPGPPEPTLSPEPIWSLEQDTQNGAACFGSSFALADLNGDGHKDLVAALPSCNWAATLGMGKVGLYAGTGTFFSRDAVLGDMTWQNTSTRTSGRNMVVAAGNVNGDGYADLLVRGFYGVQVFTGKADLATVLSAPVFRVPGNGIFGNAGLRAGPGHLAGLGGHLHVGPAMPVVGYHPRAGWRLLAARGGGHAEHHRRGGRAAQPRGREAAPPGRQREARAVAARPAPP